MEKLQLLNSPEEHQRRLQEVPIVHSDPNMDPRCESEDNAGELDEKKRGSQGSFYGIETILVIFRLFNLKLFL